MSSHQINQVRRKWHEFRKPEKRLNKALTMTKIIQVLNVAPTTEDDQMRQLFGYLGRIDELYIYPME